MPVKAFNPIKAKPSEGEKPLGLAHKRAPREPRGKSLFVKEAEKHRETQATQNKPCGEGCEPAAREKLNKPAKWFVRTVSVIAPATGIAIGAGTLLLGFENPLALAAGPLAAALLVAAYVVYDKAKQKQ